MKSGVLNLATIKESLGILEEGLPSKSLIGHGEKLLEGIVNYKTRNDEISKTKGFIVLKKLYINLVKQIIESTSLEKLTDSQLLLINIGFLPKISGTNNEMANLAKNIRLSRSDSIKILYLTEWLFFNRVSEDLSIDKVPSMIEKCGKTTGNSMLVPFLLEQDYEKNIADKTGVSKEINNIKLLIPKIFYGFKNNKKQGVEEKIPSFIIGPGTVSETIIVTSNIIYSTAFITSNQLTNIIVQTIAKFIWDRITQKPEWYKDATYETDPESLPYKYGLASLPDEDFRRKVIKWKIDENGNAVFKYRGGSINFEKVKNDFIRDFCKIINCMKRTAGGPTDKVKQFFKSMFALEEL